MVAEVDFAFVNEVVIIAFESVPFDQIGRELGTSFGLLGLRVFLAEVGQQVLLKEFVDGENLLRSELILLRKIK